MAVLTPLGAYGGYKLTAKFTEATGSRVVGAVAFGGLGLLVGLVGGMIALGCKK
jgi:hypothetical protein